MRTRNSAPAASDRDHGARVRDDSQLRDIEELVAKLQLLSRQLSVPAPAVPAPAAEGEAETG